MSTRWVAQQILSLPRTPEPARVAGGWNPKPPGVMQPGSATLTVYEYLASRPGRAWYSRRQIVAGTGRTGKSVDWALLFLRHTGRVESSRDESRCSRYLRYRVMGP